MIPIVDNYNAFESDAHSSIKTALGKSGNTIFKYLLQLFVCLKYLSYNSLSTNNPFTIVFIVIILDTIVFVKHFSDKCAIYFVKASMMGYTQVSIRMTMFPLEVCRFSGP